MPSIVNRLVLPAGWTASAVPSLVLNSIDCGLMAYLTPGERVSVTLPGGSSGKAVSSDADTMPGGFVKNSLLNSPLSVASIPNTVQVCPTDDLVPNSFGNISFDIQQVGGETASTLPEGFVTSVDESGQLVVKPLSEVAADAASAAATAVPNASADVIAAAATAATTAVSSVSDSTSSTQSDVTSDASGTQRFCGTEERVSTHTCNSLHPATAIDTFGNIGVSWHDTRDGTHEIYFRALASKISPQEALEALAAQGSELKRVIDLDCFFPDTSGLGPEDLASYNASQRCTTGGDRSGLLVRSENGRLDVNVASRSMTLSVEDQAINFVQAGVQPGSLLRIETGSNANLQVVVTQALGPNVLAAGFVDGAVTDSGFVFAIEQNPTVSLTSCETRLTCSEFTSTFPDVVVDSDGRFHILYQSNDTGENQLYYIQLAPSNIGIKDACGDSPPINKEWGFGQVPVGTPGSVTFADPDDETVQVAFRGTGQTGRFFSFGNRFLPTPVPNKAIFTKDRTGIHKLFRDFATGAGRWTGTSLAEDREAWNQQIALLGSDLSPDVVFGSDHPVAEAGDFGTRFLFENVAFVSQTPPDAGILLRTVSLPIRPKCTPRGPSGLASLREQDLVQAPKAPLPPSFQDPVDISQILNSPNVQIDSDTPGRFTIEGDAGGTIFTNVIQQDARGQLSRLVFRKDAEKDDVKFILGQQMCGDFNCGVISSLDATETPPSVQYKLKLQVWKGSDYRFDPSQILSAQMSASLLFEKEFRFDQGEEMATFVFEPGELVLPQGQYVFFVPIAGDDTEFSVEAVGGGNAVWTTDSAGLFENYSAVPFTLKPYSGLNASVYYDGILVEGQASSIVASDTGDLIINTRTAQNAVTVAFGQQGGDDGFDRAYAVSQGFSIDAKKRLRTVLVRMAAGTSAGVDTDGSSIPAEADRNMIVEITSDAGGIPGSEVIASVTVPAGDMRPFDDFDDVPSDSQMGDLFVSFNDLVLDQGDYHLVFREEGDDDAGGRFFLLTDTNGSFFVGNALWNDVRPIESDQWNLLAGHIQLRISLTREGNE